MPPFDPCTVRERFPALRRRQDGRPVAYFDGPAGSQTPQSVIDAVADYLASANANRGAEFATSRRTDELLDEAHRTLADFLGAEDADEIVFGPNMTSLTFAVSRALARTWRAGDEILVSRLDHDANVTPWVLAARDAGAVVRHIDIRLSDCTLDLESFHRQLTPRTRLVAVGYASNATGTINPVAEIVSRSKEVGAEVFIDAVHYAPHGLIDVRALGCDYLVCSAYKFFGPHVGVLWGRRERLEGLQPPRLRPAPGRLPGSWMTGTQNHEGIAGTAAAVEYLAALGEAAGGPLCSRRAKLRTAFERITAHERELVRPLLEHLTGRDDFRVWGLVDPERLDERAPTVSVTHARWTPRELSAHFTARGLWTWAGNHYALPFTEAAGLEPHGTLRIGLLHYNTAEEVDRLRTAIDEVEA